MVDIAKYIKFAKLMRVWFRVDFEIGLMITIGIKKQPLIGRLVGIFVYRCTVLLSQKVNF